MSIEIGNVVPEDFRTFKKVGILFHKEARSSKQVTDCLAKRGAPMLEAFVGRFLQH